MSAARTGSVSWTVMVKRLVFGVVVAVMTPVAPRCRARLPTASPSTAATMDVISVLDSTVVANVEVRVQRLLDHRHVGAGAVDGLLCRGEECRPAPSGPPR